MTSQQVEFLNTLSPQQRSDFDRMTNDERSRVFNSYLSQKNGNNTSAIKQRSTTNTLLSMAIDKFGSKGKQYVQENFDMFGGNAGGSVIQSGLSGVSNFLATGDTGQALEMAAISGGSNYATNFLNDLIGEKAIESGTEVFDSAISEGYSQVDAQAFGEKSAKGLTATYAPAAAGVVSGLTNYALNGDAGEALEAGATTAGKQYLTNYASTVIEDQVTEKALSDGMTRAAASQVGAEAAASFVPVIGGVVGGVTGFLSSKGDSADKKGAAIKGAMIGTAAATGPYGWVVGAGITAIDALSGIAKQKRNKRKSTWFEYDSKSGKMTLADGNIVGGDSMEEFNNNSNARLNLHYGLKVEADRRMAMAEQATAGMSTEERNSFYEGLGDDYFNPVVKVDEEWMKKTGELSSQEESAEHFSKLFAAIDTKTLYGDTSSPESKITRLKELRDKGWSGTIEEMERAKNPALYDLSGTIRGERESDGTEPFNDFKDKYDMSNGFDGMIRTEDQIIENSKNKVQSVSGGNSNSIQDRRLLDMSSIHDNMDIPQEYSSGKSFNVSSLSQQEGDQLIEKELPVENWH